MELQDSDLAEMPADDLIEIHDSEVNPQQLMAEIRRRIQLRRKELGYEKQSFPTFGTAATCPQPPSDIPYPPDLYHHLRRANDSYLEIQTGATLAPSPATGVPLLGRLWRLVRGRAHELVLFYVNRSVAHQVVVNRHLISVVNVLALQSQDEQRRIGALEELVSQLKTRD